MDTKLLQLISPFSSIRSHVRRFEPILGDSHNILLVDNDFFTKSLVTRIMIHFPNTRVLSVKDFDLVEDMNSKLFGINLIWKKKIRRKDELTFSIFTKLFKYFLQPNNIVINIFEIHDVQIDLEKHLHEEMLKFYRIVLGPQQLQRKQLIHSMMNETEFINEITKISDSRTAKMKSKRYLKEISADKSYSTLKHMKRLLDVIWHFTLDGIYIDKHGLEKVRELSKSKQIIYLPSHRSHVDYLIIGYLLLKYDMDVPLVAAGINLSFFPVGRLFRRCGAYFLRRSFKGNPLYSASFYAYLDTLMNQRSNQMFYIEGGRSRTGKLLSPKFGMLNMLVRSFLDNNLDDIYFVPLSTDYGKLFEGKSYIDELRGAEKQKESIFAMFDTLKFLKRKQGITYIQFSEPFSLREYMNKKDFYDDQDHETFNAFIKDLGFDVLHQINKVVTITPSAIISIILLSNPKRGIKKNDLLRMSHIIYMFLKRRDYRLAIGEDSFKAQIEDVLENFAFNGYVKSVHTDIDLVYKVQDTHRPFLDYYKNTIIHLFLPLAFISTILLSSRKEKVALNKVYQEIEVLKQLFKYEFVYDIDVWKEETILETLKFLRFLKEIRLVDDHIHFEVQNSIWTEVTSNIIRNFLEAYHIVLTKLGQIEKTISQKQFLKNIQSYSHSLYEVGEISMLESNSQDMFKNAISYCVDNELIDLKEKRITINEENRDLLNSTISTLKVYLL